MTLKSIAYLTNPTIFTLLQNAPSYQKKSITMLRRATEYEVGAELVTYVKDQSTGLPRKESSVKILESHIIARNPATIGEIDGQPIFNEWVISPDVVIKNYGRVVFDNLKDTFQAHRKQALLKAIPFTPDIGKELGVEGTQLPIKVTWSDEPMIAEIGDYLTDQGYSVAAENMTDYVKVD